ncbi:hypothetical protein GCM10011316_38690 [Roseibium aquae]|uniref:Adenylate cyclase n=1 Tax=Roseibium aquae TaxID=1323746 RepID=A0A916X3F7_9HYPH|nr:adenylate/guanylate cyclase domain-containing protein [Roseibium aquae]GGB63069.1 hypothetical protein GCM10011316_38690 [Roseibium aquae]
MNLPFTRLIGLGFGAFVACALALVLGLSVMANFRNTFSLLNDKAILTARSMETQIRTYFDGVEESVINLKPYFDTGDLGFGSGGDTLSNMTYAMASNSVLTVLVATDPLGRQLGVYRDPEGNLFPFTDNAPDGADPSSLPELTPESGATWGKLLRNEFGLFANVSVPLVREGQLYATLTAAVALEEVALSISNLDEGPDMTTFILADGDQVIMHSDATWLQTGGRPLAALPSDRLAYGDPVLNAIYEGEPLSEFHKAADLGVKLSMIEAADDEFLMMQVVIPGYSAEPWILGQYIRSVTFSREVRRLAGSAFVGFMALVVAVLAAVWIGRRVARPLRDLAKQSARVGTLSLDEVEPLPRSRVAELDQVALAFNAMVEGLKAMNIYVPHSLFIKLMRLGGSKAAEAREAELTVLFTDIVGFTALSQNMSAPETARELNDHFAILVRAVEEEGGTVDKFIGDGMLAFWGAPDAQPDHAAAAIRAARKIAEGLRQRNAQAARTGEPVMHMRIGIHTGSAVVGNVGALDRWNYTVVGDTVNAADRLQSLGREVEADAEILILASAQTVARLPGEAGAHPVGAVELRGRAGNMEVWRIDPCPAQEALHLAREPAAE